MLMKPKRNVENGLSIEPLIVDITFGSIVQGMEKESVNSIAPIYEHRCNRNNSLVIGGLAFLSHFKPTIQNSQFGD